MKKYLLIIALLALIGSVVAYRMYNKPHVETADSTADVVITPAELLAAYTNDEMKADSMYLDKILEVEGVVVYVNDVENGGSISLFTGHPMSYIICEFENKADVANVKVGDQVKVKGFCTGKLMDIVLSRCSL
jgi:hypothetical protein